MNVADFVATVQDQATPGDPDSVISTVDALAPGHGLMHLGSEKGAKLDAVLAAAAPKRILELGCFFGYSAIYMARHLPAGGDLVSIDADPDHVELARGLVEFAGLSSVIKILHGTAAGTLPGVAGPFGFVLIDHYASNYHGDLRSIETLELLAPGAVVVADNAVMHASSMSDYLSHVRDGGLYRSELHTFEVGHHGGARDGMEISTWLGA